MSGFVQRTADMIERDGEQVTLRRTTNSVHNDITVWAKVADYQPHELIGTITQGDRRAVISNREIERWQWPGPPIDGDQMIIPSLDIQLVHGAPRRTMTVRANATTIIGTDIIRHDLQVRGG